MQPQWLVSGTRVAGSYKCLRQAVLEERCGGSPNGKATLGTLLHELVQVMLQAVDCYFHWQELGLTQAKWAGRNDHLPWCISSVRSLQSAASLCECKASSHLQSCI